MSLFGRQSLIRVCCILAVLGWWAVGTLGLQACSGGETKPPTGGCKSNDDCKTETSKKICDKNKEVCVQCLDSSDCAKSELCDQTSKTCRAGCSTDDDCKTAFPDRPNAKVGCTAQKCVVKCDDQTGCKADERCRGNVCQPNVCTADGDCGAGEKCNGGKCDSTVAKVGKYQQCQGQDNCEEGLVCLTYKGGSANYCWKPCAKGCDDTEVCVEEANFAEGHSVCMKAVDVESGLYNYDQGTACKKGLITLSHGSINYGSCWKDCVDQCLDGRVCLPHPGIADDTKKFCFKPCSSDSDCPKDVACKQHEKAEKKFYCLPQ